MRETVARLHLACSREFFRRGWMYVTTTDHEDGQSVALLTAYRAGLEEAAKVCESLDNAECDTGYGWTNTDCAEAIRALKDKP